MTWIRLRTADSGLRAPVVVRNDVFGASEGMLALNVLVGRYAERPRLPLIIAPTYFHEIVRAGVGSGVWHYYDRLGNIAYDSTEPITDIQLDADHFLALPAEVERQGIQVWSPEPEHRPR